ncbi:T9SS type A sorting domain-containing protein [Niastella sp. OAS944]|uniref:T9SS type A sorting domain-containing protein n=1 Tax=Niastella sp. OAS944 TaxID=2664089 RepID=UPI0034918552|nr:hypothetical protein [Chitinophagaceae bacterium OAS944]
MKKKLFAYLAGILITFSGYAQIADNAPCITGNPHGSGFIDWTQQNFTIHTNALGSTTIQSPFYLTSLNNPNVNEFSKYTNKDFNTTDGWELWKYDFGTPTARTDVPYFILYNRHTGALRVFLAFANLYGQNNAISIELKYKDNSYRSALLENYNNNTGRYATQAFSNNVKPVLNSNYYLNSVLTWYHSDFYLHFDPCICNFKSSLVLEVKLSNNGDFKFDINGTAIQNISGGENTDGNGRWGEKGIFSSFLDFSNQPYKSVSIFRDVYAGLQLGKNIGESTWFEMEKEKRDAFKLIFNTLIDNVAIVSSVANFFTALFDGNSSQPVKPMVFDIKLQGKGTITYTYNYAFNELVVPGSEQTLLSTTILPYYNNPAGVFTLLKEPTINYYQWIRYADEWTPERHETNIDTEFQLKDEPLFYSVNPHAGFDLSQSTIKASLVFEGSQTYESEIYDLGCVKDYRKLFSYYTSTSPTIPEWNLQEGWVPYKVMLKIVANFKVAGSNLRVPYVATFNLNQVQVNSGFLGDQVPSPSCSATYSDANSATVKSICNSSEYTNKVSQYARISTGTEREIESLVKKDIKIYPNPVNDHLTISLPKNNNYNNIQIDIIDLLGKSVASKKYQGTNNSINFNGLSSLSGGLYFVRLTDGNGQVLQVSKFIKK